MKTHWFALLILALLAWFAFRYINAERQHVAVDALTKLDAQVVYENQAKRMGGPFIPTSEPPGPKWLHSILGVDFFDSVVVVYGDFGFSDAHVQHLTRFPKLRSFQAEDSLLTDKGVSQIAKFNSLRLLNVSGSQLTDEGTGCFQNMPNLKSLQLWNTSITDKSVDNLAKLDGLESLYLGDSLISDAAFTKLKSELPDCEIQWSKRAPPKPLPEPVDAKYADLLHQLITVVLNDKSLESTIESYGPEKIDHVVLDSTSIPWPEKLESTNEQLEYVHLRTYRDTRIYSKNLRKSDGESLCIRIDKFDLNAKRDDKKLFDGPIVIVIYNLGGNNIGGCQTTFSAKSVDGKWNVKFESAIDP